MNILYTGKYKQRFRNVTELISNDDKSVIDLCFGDTYIANYCSKKNILWTGYDLSSYFVKRARNLSFNAIKSDVLKETVSLKSDVCIIIGSLYHFEKNIDDLFEKMTSISSKIIISEPIKNLTNGNVFFSYLAKNMTKSGNGEEKFRYTKETLINELEKQKLRLKFSYKIIKENRDLLILIAND
jgi:hypothetical protein